MSRFLSLFLSLVLLSPIAADATAIVAVRSPEGIVIAADSLMTVKTTQGSVSMGECKIRRTGEVFYALAGLSRDPERGFDVWQLTGDSLAGLERLETAADRVAAAVESGLRRELQRVRSEAPELYNAHLGRRSDPLVRLLLAAVEEGTPRLIFLGFRQKTVQDGEPAIIVERRSCPGDCKADGVSLFFLGEHEAMDACLKREKVNWREPAETARLLLEEEIRARTPGVGPPVDLLRIDREGAVWIARKARCAEDGDDAALLDDVKDAGARASEEGTTAGER